MQNRIKKKRNEGGEGIQNKKIKQIKKKKVEAEDEMKKGKGKIRI